jgi:hypothetical protein
MSEDLLDSAELLMEIEGYEQESMKKSENAITIKASKSDSDKTVLIYIVTSNAMDVNQANAALQILEKENVDKLIVFAHRFLAAAKAKLKKRDIECFTEKLNISTVIPLRELYSTVTDYVNQLCTLKCGAIPKSESDCKGYSAIPIECSSCGGSGRMEGRNRLCNICLGTGFRNQHYSCKVRLISDNADYHQENRWINQLQNDLLALIKLKHRAANDGESVDSFSSQTKGKMN